MIDLLMALIDDGYSIRFDRPDTAPENLYFVHLGKWIDSENRMLEVSSCLNGAYESSDMNLLFVFMQLDNDMKKAVEELEGRKDGE